MRSASIAEWILSLVTTPERATTTVGDLLENSSAFWFSVFGTFVSLVIDRLTSSPARVIGWALGGFVAQFLVEIPGNSLAPHEGDVFTTTTGFSDVNIGIVTLIVVSKVGWAAHYNWPGGVFAQSYVAGAVLFRLRYLHKHA